MEDQPWEWQSQLTWSHQSASHPRIQHRSPCAPSHSQAHPAPRHRLNRVLYVKNSISEEPRQAKPCGTHRRATDREGSKDAQRDLGCSVAKRQSQIQDLCCKSGGTLPRHGSNNSSSIWLINQALPSLLRDFQAQELTPWHSHSSSREVMTPSTPEPERWLPTAGSGAEEQLLGSGEGEAQGSAGSRKPQFHTSTTCSRKQRPVTGRAAPLAGMDMFVPASLPCESPSVRKRFVTARPTWGFLSGPDCTTASLVLTAGHGEDGTARG